MWSPESREALNNVTLLVALHLVRCDVEAHLDRGDRCCPFNACITAPKVRIYLSSMSGLGIVCRRLPFLAGCCAR